MRVELTASTRGLGAAVLALAIGACGGGGGGTTAGGAGGGAVVTTTAPGAPTGVLATPGNGSASIAFTAPASNGGSTITGFTASCTTTTSVTNATGTASPITVSGLINGLIYSCVVTASNAVGTSAPSTAATVTPSTGAPGAPTLQSATPANASVVMAFLAPASAGTSAISGYTASCAAGATAISRSGTASPILVLGLANGTGYSCAVTATNAEGSGPASASLSVVPAPSSATPAGVAEFTKVDFAAVAAYANPVLPAYYDQTVSGLDNTPPGNAINDRQATLGRVLFHDKRLSINDAISCASCHQQASGFSDPRQFSTGFSGVAFTSAHSMRLGNVRYYAPASMFWDKRAASLEAQASQPIQNAVEMGWTAAAGGMAALTAKMDATTYYRDLFNFAFGSPAITEARIQQAIAQFERAMTATSSRWDQGYAVTFNAGAPNRGLNIDLPNFTAQENRGRQIFMTGQNAGGGGCNACHQAPTFSLAANSQSNGLDVGETRIFKSPSLKNIGVGGPYMHDGRFTTLEQVVEFYDHGVQVGPALDNRLRQGPGAAVQLNLSVADKAALVAFLRTLDDASLNTDPRFANPMNK